MNNEALFRIQYETKKLTGCLAWDASADAVKAELMKFTTESYEYLDVSRERFNSSAVNSSDHGYIYTVTFTEIYNLKSLLTLLPFDNTSHCNSYQQFYETYVNPAAAITPSPAEYSPSPSLPPSPATNNTDNSSNTNRYFTVTVHLYQTRHLRKSMFICV